MSKEVVELEVYNKFVNELEVKMADFISTAKDGSNSYQRALDARKLSLSLRKDLQEFKALSTGNDLRRRRPRSDSDE